MIVKTVKRDHDKDMDDLITTKMYDNIIDIELETYDYTGWANEKSNGLHHTDIILTYLAGGEEKQRCITLSELNGGKIESCYDAVYIMNDKGQTIEKL